MSAVFNLSHMRVNNELCFFSPHVATVGSYHDWRQSRSQLVCIQGPEVRTWILRVRFLWPSPIRKGAL